MLKKKKKEDSENPENTAEMANENGQTDGQEQAQQIEQAEPEISLEEKHKEELTQANDKFLRLYAEFDNFRRRTIKEREDARKTEGKDVIVALLPVLDDFERAIRSMENATDIVAVKEGVALIQNKMKNILAQKGLKEMQSIGTPFDADLHEAITNIPAPTDDLKGKVIDEMEKGYELNEKVIRFAKVIVGA
ncbi:nucleotide exchange factor GrpE [Mucilaginibacter sp. ZB1P21]|uniref:Protein GrpE n=2 Tax=Mucilaginibacter glaciei TaxID=2772109 RepID=A0A926S399_9SPHI|nr:nucleotide exchange factor GrpE [Mucilaginibacter glaciei]